MNILVVDDYETNRCLIRCLLEAQNHQVIEAENGQLAVEAVQSQKLDLVLMDVMMPVMDGYEATRIIKSQIGQGHLPVIFLTAVTKEEALADALAVGGDDFLVKPFNEEILYAKIKAHSRIKYLHQEISEKNQALRDYKNIMDEERDIAKHVFKTALKDNQLDQPHIQSYVSPATTFNGDLLLGMMAPSGNFYLLMADFTGHGLPAAIGAFPLSQEFFKLARKGCSVGDMARNMNDFLKNLLPSSMFCAATIIEQSSNGEAFTLWSGGVPYGYLLGDDGRIKSEIKTMHMPLGVLDSGDFERDVHVLKLQPGESIFTFTDGLTEAENNDGVMFGERRLEHLLNDPDIKDIDGVISAHTKFMGEQKADDDITLLRVFAAPLKPPETLPNADGENSVLEWSLNFDLKCDTLQKDLPVPSQLVGMIGAEVNIVAHKDYLYSIISELYSNALEHGILGLESKLKDTEDGYMEYYAQRAQGLKQLADDACIKINFRFIPGKPDRISIVIKDSGEGFDFKADAKRKAELETVDDQTYGRGICLVEKICESLAYSERGTRVDVVYCL